jgi:hypothetical protein
MGELQFGLIAIGTLVVAGVFFYNKWQERRYRRQAEAAFGARHEDVLLRSGGGETPAAEWQGTDRIEPVLAPFGPASGSTEAASRQILSQSVDFIVPIEASEDVSGASILDIAGAALARCPRSVHLEGFDMLASGS